MKMTRLSFFKPLFVAAAIIPFSQAALAVDNQKTTCSLNGEERVIEIIYPETTSVPCEVHYTKKGETQMLWSATSQQGYCEEKAAAFIQKQEGWGWNCGQSGLDDDSASDIETASIAKREE